MTLRKPNCITIHMTRSSVCLYELGSHFLTIDLFHQLATGEARDEAMRNTQLEQIKKRRDRFSAAHPYFWGAYTLTGQVK